MGWPRGHGNGRCGEMGEIKPRRHDRMIWDTESPWRSRICILYVLQGMPCMHSREILRSCVRSAPLAPCFGVEDVLDIVILWVANFFPAFCTPVNPSTRAWGDARRCMRWSI